ncbi:RDD domain-containing protein [Mycolicibacterium conceptionense]|uniref:RDD domain-containing protein n=1 Tax=Mycolicibacterium conceptionense TaxID=451644 RepID=A0A0U1DTX2_9MYCO|nr:RDD domain-containing protein [Mycolicibacterium conceptionense]
MVWQPEPVVTGDAVVLDVAIAQLPVRTLAALIDIVVIAVGYVVGVLLWSITLTQFDDALSAAILIIFTVLTLVGYPVVMETATRGRSLGKMALGLRVVADDGGPERFRQALFRGLAGFVEIWMLTGGPAVISSLLSAKGKRLGDIFAGTVVISERGPQLKPPPVMPPALAWWAASLELSGARPGAGRAGQAVICWPRVLAERHRRALARLMPQAAVAPYPAPYPSYPLPPPTSGFTPPS